MDDIATQPSLPDLVVSSIEDLGNKLAESRRANVLPAV
jgi:hypothetical protein